MDIQEMKSVIGEVKFENYTFDITGSDTGAIYLQAAYMEPDIVTGVPELQRTRKWLLSEHMTKSEIVQTAFKCCMTSMEHRTRESFTYRGKRIFGPHFHVDALWQICADKQFDCRPNPPADIQAPPLPPQTKSKIAGQPMEVIMKN